MLISFDSKGNLVTDDLGDPEIRKRERKEANRELDIRIADLKNKRKIAQALGRVEEKEQIDKELEILRQKCSNK